MTPSQFLVLTSGSVAYKISLGHENFPDLFDTGFFLDSHKRQPTVFQEGDNFRLWFSSTRKSEDIHLYSSKPSEELASIIEFAPLYLGCAVLMSTISLPVEFCRPDGSCGRQLACAVLLEPINPCTPSPIPLGTLTLPSEKNAFHTLEK